MTLLELLAIGLDKWPEGEYPNEIAILMQDTNGDVYRYSFEMAGGVWSSDSNSVRVLWLEELATDHTTAIITKEQWEAAKNEQA